jgi:hypothetical protein
VTWQEDELEKLLAEIGTLVDAHVQRLNIAMALPLGTSDFQG